MVNDGGRAVFGGCDANSFTSHCAKSFFVFADIIDYLQLRGDLPPNYDIYFL